MYFAHMYGIPLSTELQEDLDLVLRKMPDLHTELISKVYMLPCGFLILSKSILKFHNDKFTDFGYAVKLSNQTVDPIYDAKRSNGASAQG